MNCQNGDHTLHALTVKLDKASYFDNWNCKKKNSSIWFVDPKRTVLVHQAADYNDAFEHCLFAPIKEAMVLFINSGSFIYTSQLIYWLVWYTVPHAGSSTYWSTAGLSRVDWWTLILAGVGLTRLGDVFFKAYTVVSLLLDLSLQKIISSAIYFPSAPVSSIVLMGLPHFLWTTPAPDSWLILKMGCCQLWSMECIFLLRLSITVTVMCYYRARL